MLWLIWWIRSRSNKSKCFCEKFHWWTISWEQKEQNIKFKLNPSIKWVWFSILSIISNDNFQDGIVLWSHTEYNSNSTIMYWICILSIILNVTSIDKPEIHLWHKESIVTGFPIVYTLPSRKFDLICLVPNCRLFRQFCVDALKISLKLT